MICYNTYHTLLLSRPKWTKNKPFLVHIFLGQKIRRNWFATKNSFSMSGNGNNPIYPLLSTMDYVVNKTVCIQQGTILTDPDWNMPFCQNP